VDIKGIGMAGRKRRSWSNEDKRTICQQTIAPGVSVAQVARRYALNANQIFNWLKDPRFQPDEHEIEGSVFLPAEVSSADTSLSYSATDKFPPCQPGGSITFELVDGHRVMVEGRATCLCLEKITAQSRYPR
jgi:transposase